MQKIQKKGAVVQSYIRDILAYVVYLFFYCSVGLCVHVSRIYDYIIPLIHHCSTALLRLQVSFCVLNALFLCCVKYIHVSSIVCVCPSPFPNDPCFPKPGLTVSHFHEQSVCLLHALLVCQALAQSGIPFSSEGRYPF